MGELEEKIKKELLKSGFPLEIFCRRCLLRYKWGVSGSQYMLFDGDVKKQIDAMGHFQEKLPENTTIFYTLYVECKKNHDNPWIFFKDELPWQHMLIEYENIELKSRDFEVINSIEDLHFNKTPYSSIYTMAFQGKGNQIYEAILNLLSAYRFHSEFRRKHIEKASRKFGSIHVSSLTILFDGKLYLATVEGDDSINLEEEDHIICYHREVKYPQFRHYNIEVVTKDYFPNYLDILNKDRELISNFYKREISALEV